MKAIHSTILLVLLLAVSSSFAPLSKPWLGERKAALAEPAKTYVSATVLEESMTEKLQIAGNTACNPRAQVCED